MDVSGHFVFLLSENQHSSFIRGLHLKTPQAELSTAISTLEATLRDNRNRYDLLRPKLSGRLSQYAGTHSSLELLYTALLDYQKLEESLKKTTQKLTTSNRISKELRDIIDGRARTPSSSQERTLKAWLRGDYDSRLVSDDSIRLMTMRCKEELAQYEAKFSATLRKDIDEASMVSDGAPTQVGQMILLAREADSIPGTISKMKGEMAHASDKLSFSETDLKQFPSFLSTVSVGPNFSFQKVIPGQYYILAALEHSSSNRMWMRRIEINGESNVTLTKSNMY